MIVYFSATGNSQYCANMIAEKLEDQLTDSFSFIQKGIAAELSSETPWVFVAPTYSWQMPHVFEQFIRDTRFSGSRKAYFVLTCGGDTGDAGRRLESLCSEKGLEYQGLLPVVMPDNYIVMFKAPEETEAKRIIHAARPVLEQGIARIRDGLPFPERKIGFVDRLKSGPVNEGFYRFFIKPNSFYATDDCIGCGKCAQVCVLNNVHLEKGRPVWGNDCTHCMACISRCPVQAIEYGKSTRGKRRYLCPESCE